MLSLAGILAAVAVVAIVAACAMAFASRN